MYRKELIKIHGFTLLEMILAIVVMAILSVAVLGALIRPFGEQVVDFNDVKLVVKNVDEIYYSILKKYGPSPVPGFSFGIDEYVQDCEDELTSPSIEYLLCKTNDLGDNVKYTITSSSTESTVFAPPLQSIQIWTVSYTLIFYTRKSLSGSWSEFTTVNRTLKVPQ